MTEWWTVQQATWMGAIGGSAIGVVCGTLGALSGILAHKGIGKRFMITAFGGLAIIGSISLVVGIVGFCIGQPYHVSYPLVLGGFILTMVMGCLVPVIRMRYRQSEARKMEAQSLRQG